MGRELTAATVAVLILSAVFPIVLPLFVLAVATYFVVCCVVLPGGRAAVRALAVGLESVRQRRQRRIERRQLELWNVQQQAERRQADEQFERAVADDRQRRELHLACRLAYDRHCPHIRRRLPRKQFTAYVNEFLTSDTPPRVVRQRARKLMALIEELAGEAPHETQTVDHVREQFVRKRQTIDACEFDSETKASLVAQLAREEYRAVMEVMKR